MQIKEVFSNRTSDAIGNDPPVASDPSGLNWNPRVKEIRGLLVELQFRLQRLQERQAESPIRSVRYSAEMELLGIRDTIKSLLE